MAEEPVADDKLCFALRMAALLPSVRALFDGRNTASRSEWERHIVALLSECISSDHGAVLVDDYVPEHSVVPGLLVRAVHELRGPVRDQIEGGFAMAGPILVRGDVAGLIYLERSRSPYEEDDGILLTAIADTMAAALDGAYRQEWLESEVQRLEGGLPLNQMLAGESAAVRQLRERIERIAPTTSTVLIIGESGTGKELVARAIHKASPRAQKPFVGINCAALTETLLESELFGHEKGAFTGAISQKRGRMECGEGGSVFLDEIGEMPVSLQAKLLRVLQNREFERVGGTRTIPLDIRLIAATNRNLEEAAQQGTFRQDLYYRLNVITIRTPPLRDHPEDVVTLALRFAAKFAQEFGREITGIAPDARAMLRSYPWPGNVRELENAIEYAVVLGSSAVVRAEDLPESVREIQAAGPQVPGQLQDTINQAKRGALTRAFQRSRNDHNEAARLLGVHPNYLYRLIRNLGMHELLKGIARE